MSSEKEMDLFYTPEKLLEEALEIIESAGNGNWDTELRSWKLSATVWRAKYRDYLEDKKNVSQEDIFVTFNDASFKEALEKAGATLYEHHHLELEEEE